MSEVTAFLASQTTGRSCRSSRQLRATFPARYRSLEKEHFGLPTVLIQLEDNFLGENVGRCKTLLQVISRRICEITNVHYQANRDGMILMGGVEMLLRILSSDFEAEARADRAAEGAGAGAGGTEHESGGLFAGVRAAIGGLIGVGGGREGGRDTAAGHGTGGRAGAGGADPTAPAATTLRSDCHNEALAILRELCFSVAGFSDYISVHDHLVARLFALMGDKHAFDNAVGLAEEVLAVREESYLLSRIPNLQEMLRGFTSLQLAFFCRILALVVFEPEGPGAPDVAAPQRGPGGVPLPKEGPAAIGAESERLEGALTNPNAAQAERYAEAVARSAAIAAAEGTDCPAAVAAAGKLEGTHSMGYNAELNHAALLAVPELLPRLVKLLRLQRVPLLEQILSQMPLSPDMLPLTQLLVGLHDRDQIGAAADGAGVDAAADVDLADLQGVAARGGDGAGLLSVLTGGRGGDAAAAEALAAAGMTPAGGHGLGGGGAGGGPGITDRPAAAISLQTLTLVTHQVEVLFVLCALLGGRCKQHAQDRLASLGLVSALNSMFNRIDWGAPPPTAPEPHGVHGPGCACNPESALKIQYLRLVHNFCDRDCDNSHNKRLLLLPSGADRTGTGGGGGGGAGAAGGATEAGAGPASEDGEAVGAVAGADEAEAMMLGAAAVDDAGGSGRGEGGGAPGSDEGLMGKIVQVLLKEPSDSVYRFWLASCVEAFLRGSDPVTQGFVASHGLMEHLVGEILAGDFKSASSLQINFDLLGELLKFNPQMLERLNELLYGRRFEQLVEIIVTRLVDSNVFVRSLLLSLVHLRCGGVAGRPGGRGVGLMQSQHVLVAEGDGGEEAGGGGGDVDAAGEAAAAAAELVAVERELGGGAEEEGVAGEVPADVDARGKAAAGFSGQQQKSAAGEYLGDGGAGAWREWSSSCSQEWNLSADDGGAGCSGREVGGKLEQFMSRNCLRLLRDLMGVVSVDDINQDNICVINTALIFFVFSHRSGELARDLAALRALDATLSGGGSSEAPGFAGLSLSGAAGLALGCARPGGVCANIRAMLDFWRSYYCSRGRDCVSLEYSSTIPFYEWLSVVEVLCGPPDCPTSLSYSPPSSSVKPCSSLSATAAPLRKG